MNLEKVESFKYLGSTLLPNGQAKNEIRLRVDVARRAFLSLARTLWRRTEINLRTKLHVFRAAIRPILLYGCETWPLRKEDIRRLEVFDHWCLRLILKVRWSDRVSNDKVRQRCLDIPIISSLIQNRRLQWFGHVLRKSENEPLKQVLNPSACPQWRARLGGQLKTWLCSVKEDVDHMRLQVVHGTRRWNRHWITICSDLATDRKAWKASIRDIQEADSSFHRSYSP